LGGPLLAAEEAYANRAYPASDIPIVLTQNAAAAWAEVKGRGVGRGKNVPGQWTLIGPSTANFPAILTFSGADYTTSGRVTALGLYKTVDGVNTFNLPWNGNGGIRGVNKAEFDPLDHTRIYAAAWQQGIWRSTAGGPFEQVFVPTAPSFNTDRTEFALTVKDG